jgi:hypothetical protein
MEYTSVDGFVGILTLDVASIKVETAGTKTSSYTTTITREYPHLSSNDSSLVPKTVEEKGKTYTLAGVDWRVGNTVTVDYDTQPEYYTAVASYTATGTSTTVTGYVTTAVYNGALAKLSQGRTVYTAYFEGKEIRNPLEMIEPSPAESATAELVAEPTAEPTSEQIATPTTEAGVIPIEEPTEISEPTAESTATPPESSETNHNNNAWLAIIPILGAAAGVLYYILKKRKGQSHNEKTDNPAVSPDADSDDGNPGSCG